LLSAHSPSPHESFLYFYEKNTHTPVRLCEVIWPANLICRGFFGTRQPTAGAYQGAGHASKRPLAPKKILNTARISIDEAEENFPRPSLFESFFPQN